MRLESGYENRRARIEMLPLIDIVFLLLVFFIYAMLSMVAHRGMKVELPAASTALANSSKDYVSITLTRDNAVYVGGEPVAAQDVPGKVMEHARGSEQPSVFISADSRAEVGMAIRILDLLRSEGIREISFECREKPVPEGPRVPARPAKERDGR